MTVFGRTLSSWLVSIVLAVLIFVLITEWPLPQLLAMIGLGVPGNVLTIIGVLVALLVLFGNYRGVATRVVVRDEPPA